MRLFGRATGLLVGVAMAATVFVGSATTARAQSDGSLGVLIVGPPPGFVEWTGGINGPITGAGLSRFAPNFGTAFDDLVKANSIAGYAATWSDHKGGSAVVMLYRLKDDGLAANFYADSREAVTGPGGSTFAATGIPNATGYATTTAGTFFLKAVLLRRGRFVAYVFEGSKKVNQYTAADVIAIAKRQFDRLPSKATPPADPKPVAYRIGQVVGALIPLVLIAAIIGFFVRRGRRRRDAGSADLSEIIGQCQNGHPIHAGGSFCAQCGAPLIVQPREPSSPHGSMPPT